MTTSTAAAVLPGVPAAAGRSRAANQRRLSFGVWWWAVPGVILVVLGQYVASGFGAWLAFTDAKGYGAPSWVGLDNFVRIFTTPAMNGAVINTLLMAAAFVVFTNVAALGFALLLNRALKTRHVLQALVFAPAVISPLAVAYVFRFIFEHDGALNAFLGSVGLAAWERTWLGDPATALGTVMVVLVWQNVGMLMVIYLAGLTAVPPELEEAAAMDGAGVWARFWYIVRPLLKPAALIAITLTLVNGLKVFDQVMAMTGGGPYGASDTLATVMYRYTYSFGDYGLGAALALTLSVLILIAAGIQQWVMRTRAKEIA